MEFIRYNANPKGWKTGDCVVRAIATATQQTWEKTYEELCTLGKKKCRMPNDTIIYKAYLKDKGFIEEKQLKDKSGNWYDIEKLIDTYPYDILLINCSHHLTVSVRGHLVDTWNCGHKKAGKFWRLPITNTNDEHNILGYIEYLKENKTVVKKRLI